MPQTRLRIVSTLLALACLAADASAIGFGAAPQSAVLGQGLDFVVPVRLDSGESLAPECVAAEVAIGDTRLPSTQVRAQLEGVEAGAATVRVVTLGAIDEPVVTVAVALGCPTRLSRRFVLLADPAPTAPSAPVTMPVEAAAPLQEPPRPLPPTPAPPQAKPAAPAAGETAPPRRVDSRVGSSTRPSPSRRAVRKPPAAASAPPATSRLRLDAVEPATAPPPSASDSAPGAAAAAASAASAVAAAEAAASAAADRVAALEQAIAKLQAEAQADRAALRALRQRAATSDSAERWAPYLWVAVTLLAVLSLWLALRLRALQRERQQVWWNAAAASGEGGTTLASPPPSQSAEPTTTAEATLSGGGTRPGVLSPAARVPPSAPTPRAADPEPEPATQRTQQLPPGWRDETQDTRDVTIEELIDLEQQAEFFIVLGQEDAAIDLLVDHLRSTGGGSPMPYLKLLEIYRRRGDREAYERTRARFNHRFNAYAPDWEADVLHGRSLEDYPAIIARLQMAWPAPLDAMAELESLLFRKTRGELFDMPAYRDVLFLYSLARDLLDREPLESGNVDVLLPISEGTVRTQPMSLDESPEAMPSGIAPLDDQPTVPVDLDLTQPVMPDSLFGEPTRPGRPRTG